ncbi:MAG: hypothetical protein HZB68_03320 [Candidatus Aenigmarchaeota archaeon]|nr:hypothetical protein [Candidatus Aenigmarchaeota archaeon]
MKNTVKKIRGIIESEFGDGFEINYKTFGSSGGKEEHAYISYGDEQIGSLQYFPKCHVSCGPEYLENFMRLREHVAKALEEDL